MCQKQPYAQIILYTFYCKTNTLCPLSSKMTYIFLHEYDTHLFVSCSTSLASFSPHLTSPPTIIHIVAHSAQCRHSNHHPASIPIPTPHPPRWQKPLLHRASINLHMGHHLVAFSHRLRLIRVESPHESSLVISSLHRASSSPSHTASQQLHTDRVIWNVLRPYLALRSSHANENMSTTLEDESKLIKWSWRA